MRPKSKSSDYMKLPFTPGDTIPAPDAVELDADEAMRAWDDVNANEQARYARTEPAGLDAAPGYAKTQPASLKGQASASPPVATGPRLEDLLQEARRFNRVCPLPVAWKPMHAALLAAAPKAHKSLPAVLGGPAWERTPPLAKRMVFREQREWADRNGCLAVAAEQLRRMPEDAWYHMGD